MVWPAHIRSLLVHHPRATDHRLRSPVAHPSLTRRSLHGRWGIAFDRYGFPRVFGAINLASLAIPAMLLLPSLSVQYATCAVYATARVGLWASFFSFTGATFGFSNYGKLAGGGLLVQSLFCLLQEPLLRVTLAIADRRFILANGLFLALTAAQFGTVYAIWRRVRIAERGSGGGSTSSPGIASAAEHTPSKDVAEVPVTSATIDVVANLR